LEELLRLVGFDVTGVSNGKEAVQKWREWNPDLIFMDIRMPVMDGLEATKRIKGTRKGKRTCVIALTAHAFKEEKEMFIKAGCDDFIRKPFNEADIFGMVAKHLGVEYIYESPEGSHIGGKESWGLKAGDLVHVPFQWAAEFRLHAIQGDIDSLVRLIGKLDPNNKGLSQALLRMVNDYRFEEIIHLFREFNGE
jgi:CheY-like chemotaxis protein